MALKMKVETPQGFVVEDAYHRVESATLLDKTRVGFNVSVYKDVKKEAFALNSYTCAYDINGNNPIAQAYEHLKTLSEFKGAQDC